MIHSLSSIQEKVTYFLPTYIRSKSEILQFVNFQSFRSLALVLLSKKSVSGIITIAVWPKLVPYGFLNSLLKIFGQLAPLAFQINKLNLSRPS